MKHSIDKIFKNINTTLLTLLLLAFVSFLFVAEQYYSYKKTDSLKNQMSSVSLILEEQKKPEQIDILQYNYKIAQLHNDINKLKNQQQYNYISKYLLKNSKEYISDLNKLDKLINSFDKYSREHFYLASKNKNLQLSYENMAASCNSLKKLTDSMMIKKQRTCTGDGKQPFSRVLLWLL